jgi:hypothetical protein
MNISDFLPKYPNIDNMDDILNPYEDFYESIFKKKEFYSDRYEKDTNEVLTEKGQLSKHQKFIARFLSSNTMYDCLLLVHEMGTGKTCAAIGAIEQIKNETNNFKGAYIFAKGVGLLDNFVRELRDKCTVGQYVPEGFIDNEKLTEKMINIRTKKLYENYYHFKIDINKPTTFQTFTKHLSTLKDSYIINKYSNHILVVDEVHNLREKEDESDLKMYAQFHRFLHLVKNCKIILMSGTPMKDTPDEIASIMNLILPLNKQLPTGSKFLEEFLDNISQNLYTVKKDKIQELKELFKGRVSFIKTVQSNVKKEFVGNTIGSLKHLIVKPVNMSEFQTSAYDKAVMLDSNSDSGVYSNSRQASLFVFPDSYGHETGKGTDKKGFDKYVIKQEVKTSSSLLKKLKQLNKNEDSKQDKIIYSYKLTPELIKDIKGNDNEQTLKKLEKYSSTYAYVIRSILQSENKCCFVYSELVSGSGCILFSKILELFTINGKQFVESNGNESTKSIRYGLLTFDTAGRTKINNIIKRFNNPDNMHGDFIKVLIGSRVVSEGYSFYNIQKEYIMTPWYNYSETDQVIYRGLRFGAHKALLEAGENPVVSISQIVSIPQSNSTSIDLYMYQLAENKDISIQSIIRLLMESAFDCGLNYYRNRSILPLDGQRQCEYQQCDYKCDNVDMKLIEDGLTNIDIDVSTYQLYYSDSQTNPLSKKIYNLFKKYNKLNIDSILKLLENEYTEQEIRDYLYVIKSKDIFLKDYRKLYLISNVKKIMNNIEDLFHTYFKLSFDNIIENIDKNFTQFEILSALKNIIDENIIINNKYGFPSYLRENNNIYFLTSGLSIKSDYFLDYYSINPNIVNDNTFEEIFYNVQIELMNKFIEKLTKITKETVFFRLIKSLPEEVQEYFIEGSILAKNKDIQENTTIREFILKYFIDYINKIDDVWVSDKLNNGENLRCLDEKDDDWKNCDEDYNEKLKESKLKNKHVLFENPWGYYGKYNPETNVFNIVNVKEYQDKLQERINYLDSLVEEGVITLEGKEQSIELFKQDSRNIYSGKNCDTWSKFLLQKIVITVIKVDYDKDFNKNFSKEKLLSAVEKINNKKEHFYEEDELENLSVDDMKRLLFWTDKSKKKEDLCKVIKEWFSRTKFKGIDMLISDREAGIYGHTKKEKKKEDKPSDFTIQNIIPKESPDNFKSYKKEIQKLMNSCFNIKNYSLEIDDKKWTFIFKKKNLISIFTIDSKNIIMNLCFIEKCKQEIKRKALNYVFSEICLIKNPRLFLFNKEYNYNKLIKMYEECGFKIMSKDEDKTTMEFKCNKE